MRVRCIGGLFPSTESPDLPPANLSDDIATVRHAVTVELDDGNNALVISHSHGDTPANCALCGPDILSRKKTVAEIAVIALILLCAAATPAGQSFWLQLAVNPSRTTIFQRIRIFLMSVEKVQGRISSTTCHPSSRRGTRQCCECSHGQPICSQRHVPRTWTSRAGICCVPTTPLPVRQEIAHAMTEARGNIENEMMCATRSPFRSMSEETADFHCEGSRYRRSMVEWDFHIISSSSALQFPSHLVHLTSPHCGPL